MVDVVKITYRCLITYRFLSRILSRPGDAQIINIDAGLLAPSLQTLFRLALATDD